jgi:chromosome segregation ATPase
MNTNEFSDFLKIMADPVKTKKSFEDLNEKIEAANKATAEAKEAKAEAEKTTQEMKEKIAEFQKHAEAHAVKLDELRQREQKLEQAEIEFAARVNAHESTKKVHELKESAMTAREAALRQEISISPEVENEMMRKGFVVRVHATDNVAKHLEVHEAYLKDNESDLVREHIAAHMQFKV